MSLSARRWQRGANGTFINESERTKERTRMGVMKQVKAKLLSIVAAGKLLRLGYPTPTAYRGLKIGCDGKLHMAGWQMPRNLPRGDNW